jgi:hypothetical protein
MCVWGECIAVPLIFSLGTGWECACQWTVGVHNIQRISWLADELLAPTELHSVKVFSARVYKHAFPCRTNFSWNYLNFFLIWIIFLCKSINDLQRLSHITPFFYRHSFHFYLMRPRCHNPHFVGCLRRRPVYIFDKFYCKYNDTFSALDFCRYL